MKKLMLLVLLFSSLYSIEVFTIKKEHKSNVIPVKISSVDNEVEEQIKKRLFLSEKIIFEKEKYLYRIKITKNQKNQKYKLELSKKDSLELKNFEFTKKTKNINKVSIELIKIISKEDKSWLNKNFFVLERTKKKRTRMKLYDVTGETSKIVYENSGLNLFVKQKNQEEVYFTKVGSGFAELTKINFKTGNKKILYKDDVGYLIVSDIYKNKVLFTKMKRNGRISVFEINELTGKVRELVNNKMDMNISPKYSRKDKNKIYFISVKNKKFTIRKKDIKTGKVSIVLKKKSLRQMDINDDDDLLISFYNNKERRHQIAIFNEPTMKKEVNLASIGNNTYPFFLEKNIIFYLKEKSGKKRATILNLKTGDSSIFNSKIKGNIQSISY